MPTSSSCCYCFEIKTGDCSSFSHQHWSFLLLINHNRVSNMYWSLDPLSRVPIILWANLNSLVQLTYEIRTELLKITYLPYSSLGPNFILVKVICIILLISKQMKKRQITCFACDEFDYTSNYIGAKFGVNLYKVGHQYWMVWISEMDVDDGFITADSENLHNIWISICIGGALKQNKMPSTKRSFCSSLFHSCGDNNNNLESVESWRGHCSHVI